MCVMKSTGQLRCLTRVRIERSACTNRMSWNIGFAEQESTVLTRLGLQPVECLWQRMPSQRKLDRCAPGSRQQVGDYSDIKLQSPTGWIGFRAEPTRLRIPGQRTMTVVRACFNMCVSESG